MPAAKGGSVTDDRAVIGAPLDFYGVNYYNPFLVGAAPEGAEMPFEYRDIEGCPKTDFRWPVVTDGLREQLVHLRDRSPTIPLVVIHEPGCASTLEPDAAGVVADQPRTTSPAP